MRLFSGTGGYEVCQKTEHEADIAHDIENVNADSKLRLSVSSVALLLVITTILTFTTTLLIANHSTNMLPHRRVPPRLDCGSSVEEAHARGCTFDRLSLSWLPMQCSSKELDRFLKWHRKDAQHQSLENESETPWKYYENDNGTVGAEIQGSDELSTRIGDETYWTTRGEHLAHCAFMLLRMQTGLDGRKRIDGTAQDYHHAFHCVNYLLETAATNQDFDKIDVVGGVRFGYC